MARRPLVAGNWKMNGLRANLEELARMVAAAKTTTAACDILVCPPATLIALAAEVVKGSPIALGAQDCHHRKSGAHTGDISAEMLKDLGCAFVIVGHSERRTDHGETDADVRAKAEAAIESGLAAIICVGETEAERDAGRTLEVVGRQLARSVPDNVTPANVVIAYEPVWAIGTGEHATPQEANRVIALVRETVAELAGATAAAAVRILYGGSVKPDNVGPFIAQPEIDGALVGGASLDPYGFADIIQQAEGNGT